VHDQVGAAPALAARDRELDGVCSAAVEPVKPAGRLVADDRVVAEAQKPDSERTMGRHGRPGDHQHPRRRIAQPSEPTCRLDLRCGESESF